jgi:hypothetical protein
VDAGRQLRLKLRHQVLDRVRDGDGVGPGLALDAERDGALLALRRVVPRSRMRVFGAVDYVAELAQPDGRSVPVRDHHVPEFGGVHELPGCLQRERAMRSDDIAGRHVDVPGAQRVLDLVDADLARGERMRIKLHVDGVLLAAEHLHLGDAADL